MDFSIRLKQVRLSKGISQQKLGDMLGLSKQAINNYESGANTPGHATFIKLADELGVSLDFLTGRSNSKHCSVLEEDAHPLLRSIMDKAARLSEEGKEEVVGLVEKVLEKEARYGSK